MPTPVTQVNARAPVHCDVVMACLLMLASVISFTGLQAQECVSEPVAAGYRDFNYGSTPTSAPTAAKPESKLWFNDGRWWGVLWDPSQNNYQIHRFDVTNQCWRSVGPEIDDRARSRADVLWDGQKLYVLSHHTSLSSSSPGLLSRYSYDSSAKNYSLDNGFPIDVNTGGAEAMTLAKDSTGQLWLSYQTDGKIRVNRTTGDNKTWGSPFNLPVQGQNTASDDISAIVAFGGNKIGIMWSNQRDRKTYFSVHMDSHADSAWEAREDALADGVLGEVADDHLNFAIACADDGAVYAVTKTSLTQGDDPLVYLLRRESTGSWSKFVYGQKKDNHTRPIVVIDDENREIYVFAKAVEEANDVVFMKKSSLDDISFPDGLGEPFIMSADDHGISDPTSTKQNVNSTTGLLILGSDQSTHHYLHNYLELESKQPVISSFTPSTGSAESSVTVLGNNFRNATSVAFNGASASFSVDSNTQITAVVPLNATTGKIVITNPAGTATSTRDFIVTAIPAITGFTPSMGTAGTQVTISGANLNGTTDVTFNAISADFNIDSNSQITAVVPDNATTGPITIKNNDGIGTSDKDFTVILAPSISSFIPTSGRLGTKVTIFGNNLNGLLDILFNDTPALAFTVKSSTEALAIVADSTMTGPITVTNAAGSGTSAGDFTVLEASTITFEEIQTGGAADTSIVSTSGSVTGLNGQLYLAAISTKPFRQAGLVEGLGLRWTLLDSQCSGRNQTGVEVWMARGSVSGNGAITAHFDLAPLNSVLTVTRYSGVHATSPIGSLVSGNSNGADGTCSGGTDSEGYSFSLATRGGTLFSAVAFRNKNYIAALEATERGRFVQGSGGDVVSLDIVDQEATAGTTTIAGASTEIVDWAVIGLELMPPDSIPTSVIIPGNHSKPTGVSEELAILQNYPNPFNRETTIIYTLPRPVSVKLKIYNALGQEIRSLVSAFQQAGAYQVSWEGKDGFGRDVSSGIYLARLEAAEHRVVAKILLQK